MNQGNAARRLGGDAEDGRRLSPSRPLVVNRYRRAASRRHPPPAVRLQPLTIVNDSGSLPPPSKPPLAHIVTHAPVARNKFGKASLTAKGPKGADPPPLEVIHAAPAPDHPETIPSTNRSLAQLQSYMNTLSDSCRDHKATAHSEAPGEDEDDEFCDPIANSVCRDSIHTLERILPHLEDGLAQLLARATPEDGVGALMARMCDLYRDILCGDFCPQAPHLLLSSTDLLPRIYLLFQCLAYQSAHIHPRTSMDDHQHVYSLGNQICRTIAQLVNHLPDTRLLQAVVRDLIYLSQDFSVWLVYTTNSSSGATAEHMKMDCDSKKLRVSLLEESLHFMGWSSTKPEYIIDIPNTQYGIRVMQWHTFTILDSFFVMRQQQRLVPNSISRIIEDYDDHYTSLGGDVDLYFVHFLNASELRVLFLSLRQSFWASASDSISDIISLCQLQNATSRLLLLLQSDWHNSYVPNISLLQEASLLVGYSVTSCLTTESQVRSALPTASWLLDVTKGTLDCMAQLLSTLIYSPPSVSGSMNICEITGRIHRLLLPILCEAILLIDRSSSSVKHRSSFDIVLLHSIHAITCALCCGHCLPPPNFDVIQHLFYLSNDPTYADSVIFILSYFLFHSRKSRSILLDLEDVIKISYSATTFQQEDNPTTIGSKRKVPFSFQEPEKQMKKNNGQFARATFSYYDHLVAMFRSARESISRLNLPLQQRQQGRSNLTGTAQISSESFVSDVFFVTSRLQLVLLLVMHGSLGSNFSSAVPFLCRYMTESFSSLSMILEAYLKHCRNEQSAPFDQRVVDLLCSFTILVENSTFVDSASFVGVRKVCHSVLKLAYDWNVVATRDEALPRGFPFRIPESLFCAIFGSALRNVPRFEYYRTKIPSLIDVVALMEMSVTIDLRNLCDLRVIWTGPILKPVSNDDIVQNIRLNFLSNRKDQIQLEIETRQDIEQRSLFTLRYAFVERSEPLQRLLVWQTFAWIFTSMASNDLRKAFCSSNSDLAPGSRFLQNFVKVSFSDEDPLVVGYTSRELGNVLSANNWACLFALLASESEWQRLERLRCDFVKRSSNSKEVIDQILSRFFHFIDDILHPLSSRSAIPPKFLASSSDVSTAYKSAVRALCSLCVNRSSIVVEEFYVVQRTLLRLIHLWTSCDDSLRSGFCLAELTLLSNRADLGEMLRDEYWPTVAPHLFQNAFLSSSDSQQDLPLHMVEKVSYVKREHQFSRFSAFFRATALCDFSEETSNMSEIDRSFDLCLPFVVSHFIAEKNLGALQFAMSYRLYIRGQNRTDIRRHKRSGPFCLPNELVCGLLIEDFTKSLPSRQWNRDLERTTREICLEPGLVDRVVPLIFTQSGLHGVNFFVKNVLENKISIEQLVKSREMFILKYFVLELGRDPGNAELVVAAMKKAAAIWQIESSEIDRQSLYKEEDNLSNDAVGHWVSKHFMYLLVNVVQSKWSFKTLTERVSSLRCLLPVLDFLHSSDASQYLPQVLATVNAALSDGPIIVSVQDAVFTAQLKLLAVQLLSKFVRVVAKTQLEFLGQHLTSIVVSLVPILSMSNFLQEATELEMEYHRYGVSLLEWLSEKDVLLPQFAEIPFLPSAPALDSVRASLRSRGIDFDNLHTATTQGTQDASLRAAASDSGSTDGDSRGAAADASRQAALRRRLETICPLLENESVSVRRVVLQHITALLRANRELFHVLVENEASASSKQYLTVTYRDKDGFRGRWNATNFIELLLSRCIKENDPETRTLLATCFGEVGAINSTHFDDNKSHDNLRERHITDPPWHSSPHHFQLDLVTTYLVGALKAAPATSDQHKIAFTIQQLLDLLNEAGNEGLLGACDDVHQHAHTPSNTTLPSTDALQKPKMNASLICRLAEARVLDVVEPFWNSDFHETGNTRPKTPPFFRNSSTFYDWLSNWCRYMVHCAHVDRQTAWTKLFHCCRTALRTQAGLEITELILPFLVLDRLCFGNGNDHAILLNEIRDVLMFCDCKDADFGSSMPSSEKRNAVNAIFSLLDLLQHWVEPEVEIKYSKKARSPGKESSMRIAASVSDWQLSESAMRIEDLLSKIPLQLRGQAACKVGMYASALRFIEMASRSTVVGAVFGMDTSNDTQRNPNRSQAAGRCPDGVIDLMKDILTLLDDCETIEAVVEDCNWVTSEAQIKDSIRQKEALQDWQGALHEYERAQQQKWVDPSIRLGTLRCLLQLGHFDSVLQQARYMQYKTTLDQISLEDFAEVVPIAAEAACRLGRWETLSELVEEKADYPVNAISSDGLYQVHLGKALLDLQRKNTSGVIGSLSCARLAVMDALANAARESYSRSYDHVVRLQALREIEDVSEVLCSENSSYLPMLIQDNTLAWNRRLDLVSSSGATSIMNVRLVLARLANDSAFEGSLFLRMGKRARKSGFLSAAANSFSQAETAIRLVDKSQKAKLKSAVMMQIAKLNHSSGESSVALRMLGLADVESMASLKGKELIDASCQRVVENLRIEKHEMNEKEILAIFVQSALQSTRWMVEGGLKEAAEIVARFRVIHNVAPSFEKGHFHFAKYIDSLLQSRIMALQGRYAIQFAGTDDEHLRNHIISRDSACIRYVVLAIKHFSEALILDVKHVYQVLPRLLSLWFDFTGIAKQNGKENIRSGLPDGGLDLEAVLCSSQDDINKFMATTFKKISAQSLYTAIPQLISRITHDDKDTASIVQAMLRRVLIKYPAQAMWQLGWIRQSRDPQRQQIGIDIFHQATEALNKRESLHRLLVTSKTLLDYLYALAKKDVGDKVKDSMKVRPLSEEVNLSEFVPPIQAALSASLISGDSSRSRDVFPRHIPRMRAIDETVGVMASKARPKKIKVYVIAADSVSQLRKGSSDCFDIGEIHFLLKQEAKGDLRKDARVQDLNNVVNRIMSSMDQNKGLKSQSRRLHLRTFCVTCLSEDTGLLEWVPHTASLRSMISKTYNPQAESVHGKRHGKRITNFNDPNLRVKFESVCQAAYFVSGNLSKAAALFESECLSKYPPVLYWWYVLQFPDPHAWYEARTRFALSTAAWSAVGHVIGLGDRHSENILLDKTSGECVHVDFDCIFDKGLYLPKPEVIPFRLTQNMVDALGPTGADGVYTWNLKAAMSALRNNRDTLLSVLEPFVKDPVINWKRYRSQQRGNHRTTDHDPMMEAKQKMSIIDERLRGIYNLRNPNTKKIRRTDHLESQQDDELSHPIPLSVEGQVHKLIAEATSSENLVQLYVGWMPWV